MRSYDELKQDIEQFLNQKFIFRKLEIFQYFNNKTLPVFWNFRNHYSAAVDNVQEPCLLLDDQVFHEWHRYDDHTIKFLADEFQFRDQKGRFSKRMAKQIFRHLIEDTELTKLIHFNPALATLIKEGRHKVTGTVPLGSTDERRTKLEVREGGIYYLCNDRTRPFIANPCYILSGTERGPYRTMFFTNLNAELDDTKKLAINGWGFTTVFADELGLNPEQAARQRQN